ncbi:MULTISPECIES: hypothetical protein [Okeania]|uniref:Uncharacterized protein n=1 Tax=Okeania hirsuta TaxID=1458930 RepID=A0A3N6RMB6_9CYAN|nr:MULTISPECIES: hypothetical protein [Okeania]NET15441.1 hypothetical protein [Okeania sp. SIO1H6]NEP90394.1 hypothetical protein [Okeania sp. SIO2C2]NES78580.1 hypothetical protein [Okeania sp. SIO1H4]NES91090.1 hypothetical protein [Okeania sp. SIO2B9]NET21989.1 hypothetical protein [Okeania sp. SIO1H5]
MAKKEKSKKSNLLYQRLTEALENGSKVRIEAEETYYGLPVTVTKDFVEIMVLVPPDEFDEEDDAFKQVTWLVRLSSIFAIAYPTEYWSTARLEKLLEVGSNQV